MIDIILLHALWGASIPIAKKLVTFTTPVLLTGIRTTAAGLLLLGMNYVWHKKAKKKKGAFNKKYWFYYLQIMVIGVYFKYIARYWAIKYMPAVKMGFLINAGPFVAALFGYIFFNERLTKKQWIGLFIGMFGYILVLLTTSRSELAIGELFFISWPELITIIMVFAHCYYLTLSRKLIRKHNHGPLLINGIRTIGGGVLALATAFLIEPIAITNVSAFAGWLSVSILISNVICHSYSTYLLKHYSLTFVSFTSFLNMIFTGLYGAYFLQEVITWHYIVGGGTVIVGLYIFYRDELSTVVLKNDLPDL